MTQILVVHAPNRVCSNRPESLSISADAFLDRDIRKALDLEPVSELFGKWPKPKFVRRVKMGVIDDDVQPGSQSFDNKFSFAPNDSALAVYTFRTESLTYLILIRANGPDLPVPV